MKFCLDCGASVAFCGKTEQDPGPRFYGCLNCNTLYEEHECSTCETYEWRKSSQTFSDWKDLEIAKIVLRPKRPWQKEDCIKAGCRNKSTLEAVWRTASIRCCKNKECIREAAWIARTTPW